MPEKIHDDFTDLNISRQRKWQLRHPNKAKVIASRYEATEARKKSKREWYLANKDNDRQTPEN